MTIFLQSVQGFGSVGVKISQSVHLYGVGFVVASIVGLYNADAASVSRL